MIRKDRHVLAVAVACGAKVIVTQNLKDFPPVALAPHIIEAQSPDTFLNGLCDDDPEMMAQVIREQAADTQHPPLTVEGILQRIRRQSPKFAQRMLVQLKNG